ncbi:MAG: T9SS type A sorting domain-containing protein [Flavobacteriales bacterium]|jgi:hypothetical protein|nr:T9SS type A sorting domain-containing protein [Flavobacteriales bacterium]
MKKHIILVLTIFSFFFSIGQTSIVDYTIIGNESNESATAIDTLDGYLYLAGHTNECESNDGFVIKYKGDSLYQRVLIGGEAIEIIEAVSTNNNGQLFTGGYTDQNNDYDVLLTKMDTQLNIITEKTLAIANWNFCYDITTAGNNVLGVGKTHNGENYDAFIFKTDHNLDTIWTTTLNAPNNQQLNKLISYNDSIFIATGYSEVDGLGKEILLLSLNINSGDTLWSKKIGGVNDDFCNSIIKTQDGGIVGFGTTSSYVSTSEDYMLFKVDSAGNFVWSELHQVQTSIGTYNDRGIDLVELQNGDLIVASYTESYGGPGVKSTMIMFTNSLGHWLNGYIYDGGHDDIPTAMVKENDTTIYIAGIANSQTHGYADAYLMRIRSVNVHNPQNTTLKAVPRKCYTAVTEKEQETSLMVYPNPVKGEFSIVFPEAPNGNIEMYSLIGKEVYSSNYSAQQPISLPQHIKNGQYLLKIKAGNNVIVKKIVVLR